MQKLRADGAMDQPFQIAGRPIGTGCPCFVIAEAGVNHNGDITLAKRLVDTAADAGADAVKFQSFVADRLVTEDAPKAEYQVRRTGEGESQSRMLRRLELTGEMHRTLFAYCRERGIMFLSTPFDEESADLLEHLGVAAFKVPSGEVTNAPLLRHVAAKGRPIILSTGMATLSEVEAALGWIADAGNPPVALLQCVSSYPADPSDINLRAMATMTAAFGVPVGYSDHTMGVAVSLAAVALGACILEKHITLDRSLPGPDQQVSAEPNELAALVQGVRDIEAAMGDGRKRPRSSEANTASVARRSLVANIDIPKGTAITEAMLTCRRPGTGLPPAFSEWIVGRVAGRDIPRGTLLGLEMLR